MQPIFRNKDGSLTRYALACGYIENEVCNNISVRLWMEHGTYHVRSHDLNKHKRLFWKSYSLIKDARKFYKQEIRKAKQVQ